MFFLKQNILIVGFNTSILNVTPRIEVLVIKMNLITCQFI